MNEEEIDPASPLLRVVPTETSDRNVVTERVIDDLREMAEQAVTRMVELEALVQKAEHDMAELNEVIDNLLVEAVVLREKQDRHDKATAELENQIAYDKMEIRRLTDMTRKWWKK